MNDRILAPLPVHDLEHLEQGDGGNDEPVHLFQWFPEVRRIGTGGEVFQPG